MDELQKRNFIINATGNPFLYQPVFRIKTIQSNLMIRMLSLNIMLSEQLNKILFRSNFVSQWLRLANIICLP